MARTRASVTADVVVVGFGAAGACAALEAAEHGATVLIIDRFGGGGVTELSGGVVYAGGGTRQQITAGVTDSVQAMVDYLRTEIGDAVPETTLREFCQTSASMIEWLERHGVPFHHSLCPDKTSYPVNKYYLYYSGSERAASAVAAPAPRGHRTKARGTSGKVFFRRLAAAVADNSKIMVMTQTIARGLRTDDTGRVTGVSCTTLAKGRRTHRILHRLSKKPYLYLPRLGRLLHRPVVALEQRYQQELTIEARNAVILTAGGFAANKQMLREHAPHARGALPLATPADDGSGIRLGVHAGAATARLGNVSIWRFLTPPPALADGIVVNADGESICDPARYGAAIGAAIAAHGGRAWLLADRAIIARARRQIRGSTLWFQRLQAWYLLTVARSTAPTAAALAAKAGIDPGGLARSAARLGGPPYSLIDLSIRPRPCYPAPVLTLGGLVTDPATGQVLTPAGAPIPGLYAAGRTAAGLCSGSYVSGLSLADCVFAGRRAGRAAATITPSRSRSGN